MLPPFLPLFLYLFKFFNFISVVFFTASFPQLCQLLQSFGSKGHAHSSSLQNLQLVLVRSCTGLLDLGGAKIPGPLFQQVLGQLTIPLSGIFWL